MLQFPCAVAALVLGVLAPADASLRGGLRSRLSDAVPLCTFDARDGFSEVVRVSVDPESNTRVMTFDGDDANGAQTIVKCKGEMPSGCARPASNCTSAAAACPCEQGGDLDFPNMVHMAQTFVPMCQSRRAGSDPFRVLLIGLGGGALPPYILANCPNGTQVESVEYDPRVIDAAVQFFGVHLQNGVNEVERGDGGEAVSARAFRGEKYDVVLVDAFDRGEVPASCSSPGFISGVSQLLREDGVAMQTIDSPQYEKVLPLWQKVFGGDSVNGENVVLGISHLIVAEANWAQTSVPGPIAELHATFTEMHARS